MRERVGKNYTRKKSYIKKLLYIKKKSKNVFPIS